MDTRTSMLLANMMSSSGGGIPAQYEVVDWIQSSYSQYIDTGIIVNDQTITYLYCKFNMNNNSSSVQTVFGVEGGVGGGDWSDIRLFYNGNSYRTEIHIYDNNIYDLSIVRNAINEIKIENQVLTFNGTTRSLGSYKTANVGTRTLPLFCMQGASLSYFTTTKMYSFQLGSSAKNLVCDYVPVYDTVTQKYGMFDKVSQTFKPSATSSEFTGGND